jgi:hypothetical protein
MHESSKLRESDRQVRISTEILGDAMRMRLNEFSSPLLRVDVTVPASTTRAENPWMRYLAVFPV